MLLSKREKKKNLIYIISLILMVISFYINILSNLKLVVAIALTICLLFLLTLIRYNTYNHFLKKLITVLYFIFVIWMISNKVYFSFYGDYINFARIFSAAAPSIIVSAVFTIFKSISLISLIVFSIINLLTFRKAKYRYKKYHIIVISLYLFYAVLLIAFKAYNYEILSSIVTSSLQKTTDEETYKPITSSSENTFDSLINKEHKDNEYTGIAKDRNLILVQCESLQNVFTNKTYNNGVTKYTITPTINELIKNDSLYFNNCFAQIGWGNTSDAEFIVNNSFYPLAMQSIYQRCENNYFYGLPKILQKNGYQTAVYHGYVADMWNRDKFYPAEGFSKYLSSTSFPTDQFIGFGIADREFFKQATSYMKKDEGKTFNFLITLSSHTPFNYDISMSDIELASQDKDSMFGKYVINVNYLDSAINVLLNELKQKGLYDNSIIVFYGDHHGLNRSDADNYKNMTKYLGKPYNYDDMLNIPFIIHIPGLGKSETITTTCGQMDIMPTILNLMGIENDSIYFGEDVLSLDKDSTRGIGGGTYMPTGSFIDKDYIFVMSDDNIYDHATIIDRKTGGNALDVISKEQMIKKSINIQNDVKLSNTITEKNILEALLNNDTIIMNDVNPQPYIYQLNSDNDNDNYIEKLEEATAAGYNLIAVNVYKGEDEEFYVNNKLNLFNKLKLVDFLSEVKLHPNTYVILTNLSGISEDLFRYLGKNYPNLANLCIPEINGFKEYTLIKTFNMNSPILCIDKIDCTIEELFNFVANNDVFAILSSKDNFKSQEINLINKSYGIFTYTKTVSDKGEIIYYKGKNVKGFYTDSLETIKYDNKKLNRFS